MNETILIVGAFILVVILGIVIFLMTKNKNLEEVRRHCYHLFLHAEIIFGSGKGQEKFDYVVEKAYDLLPKWLKTFVGKKEFSELVQDWFDYITLLAKDYLDNGVVDNSVEDIDGPEVSE